MCAAARLNCPASPGAARHESPSQGAQPSTQNPATSSSWAAAPGCPLVIFAPTASMSLTVTASRATTGAAPRRPAATASGSTAPSTSRSASGLMSSAANVPGSSPECAYPALSTVIQPMMNRADATTYPSAPRATAVPTRARWRWASG